MILKPPKGVLLNRGHLLAKGLIGYWLMNEGGGSIVSDLSGNGNTGTFATGAASPLWVAGNKGSATSYDGGDYIVIPDKDMFTLNDGFTIITDVYPTDLSVPRPILAKYINVIPFNGEWTTSIESDGTLFFQCLDDAGNQRIKITSSFTTPVNNWYHLAFTYDGSAVNTGLNLYKNSVQDANPTRVTDGTFNAMSNYNCNVEIGAYLRDSAYLSYFHGKISYVMLYNRCLTPSEIAQLYREPFAIFEREPIELWSAATQGITGAPGAMTLNTGYWGPII